MSARIVAMVIGALLGGFVLGRLGPQEDLRRLREQVETLQKEHASRNKPGSTRALAGVRSLFNVSDQDLAAGAQARRARRAPEVADTNSVAATNAPALAAFPTTSAPTQRLDRASVSNEVERAKEAWTMRTAIARQNFIAQNALDEKQILNLDVVVEAMNLRLGASVDKWAAIIAEEKTMRPEVGLRMMTEMGTALVLSYDELDRSLPPDWRKMSGGNFELVNFIDPEVLTPLQDLEGIVEPHGRFRGQTRSAPP